MRLQLGLTALLVGFVAPAFSNAQVIGVPFGNNALFEPEIDIVNSGALLDAQATVSADRKYVTLTMRPQNAQLLALRTFNFQNGGAVQLPTGNVGGAVFAPAVADSGARGVNAPMRAVPGNGGAILAKRGITPLILKD